MGLFFSPKLGAFFDERVHGARRVMAIDEAAYAQAKVAAMQADSESYEAAVKAAEEAGEPAPHPDAFNKGQLAVIADPPLMEVDNPDCRIPADAVPVTAERHAELMAEQSLGRAIVAGEDGQPEARTPELTVEQQLAAVRRKRNAALAATDWTQVPDSLTAAKRKLWKEHRQALRDLPEIVARAAAEGKSPASVPFPTPPKT